MDPSRVADAAADMDIDMVDTDDPSEDAFRPSPPASPPLPLTDAELQTCCDLACANCDIRMFLVKQGVMPKPSLDTILFNGEEARNSAIPEDLRLAVLLREYNKAISVLWLLVLVIP